MYRCHAVTAPGLEPLTAAELAAVGAGIEGSEPGGLSFEAAPGILYAANLRLRTASRLLVRAAEFPAVSFAQLEHEAGKVHWTRWVPEGAAVHFRVTSRKSRLYHQDAIAERLERVALGSVPGATAVRAPSAADALDDDVRAPPGVQRFIVRLVHDRLMLSVDSSGANLHRRGYRLATGKAPLRETLAAGMLLALGYDGSAPLVDPLCGSGTIPIEAALLARHIPPGWRRRFAFERWPEFKPAVWEFVRGEAGGVIRERAPAPILAADRDAGAMEACAANAERAGVGRDLSARCAPVTATLSDPELTAWPPGLVVTNPPFGARVGEARRLRDLYATLGNAMRGPLAGWRLGFLTTDPALAHATGLALTAAVTTATGGLPVRVYTT